VIIRKSGLKLVWRDVVFFVTLTMVMYSGAIWINQGLDFGDIDEYEFYVSSIGQPYYQFAEYYVLGRLEPSGTVVEIDVVEDRYQKLNQGSSLQLVTGEGFLYKRWFDIKDRYERSDEWAVRGFYLGFFGVLTFFIIIMNVWKSSLREAPKFFAIGILSIGCSLILLHIL